MAPPWYFGRIVVSQPASDPPPPEATRYTQSGKQRRHLRSLGHHLEPVVRLGKQGVTTGVVEAVDEALTTHELIKVKRGQDCPQDRHEVARELDAALKAEVVQKLGRVVLLYRPRPDEPTIVLP